jgi:hypothetical protein
MLSLLSLGLNPIASNAQPVEPNQRPVAQVVVVARDMTLQSACSLQVNKVSIACPQGTVVGTFVVTEAEAKTRGENYIRYTGNKAKDNAAIDALIKTAGQKYAATRNKALSAIFQSVLPKTACGGSSFVAGSYTASNFDSPQPKIGYSIQYSLGYYNGICNRIAVASSNTYFITSGSNAYLYATAFNRDAGDLSNGFYPGCANIPHTSNYPTTLNGYQGYNFTDEVSSCDIWNHRAYGYASLY